MNPTTLWTDSEQHYLHTPRIGRLATMGPSGPQLRPVGFRVNGDAIDIGGAHLSRTQKWRNVQRDPRVAFVIDDIGDGAEFSPRGIEIRGYAETVYDDDEVIRIHPQRIISWGLDSSSFTPNARTVNP